MPAHATPSWWLAPPLSRSDWPAGRQLARRVPIRPRRGHADLGASGDQQRRRSRAHRYGLRRRGRTPVTLYALPYPFRTAPVLVATAAIDAAGHFSFTVTPDRNTRYTARLGSTGAEAIVTIGVSAGR